MFSRPPSDAAKDWASEIADANRKRILWWRNAGSHLDRNASGKFLKFHTTNEIISIAKIKEILAMHLRKTHSSESGSKGLLRNQGWWANRTTCVAPSFACSTSSSSHCDCREESSGAF
jgi:hypothetical protein